MARNIQITDTLNNVFDFSEKNPEAGQDATKTTSVVEDGFKVSARLLHGIDTLFIWMQRVQQRHALLALNDRMLKDVGISRADAFAEADKPFWRR